MNRSAITLAVAAGALGPCLLAHAQTQFTINSAQRHQAVEGWGAMILPLSPTIEQLYRQPSFAAMLRDDLGISMVRIEVPPYIHEIEDLNSNVIDWTKFNFSWMDSCGNLVKLMNQGHPHAVKVLLAVWSPPPWMKTNNNVNDGGNLRVDRYPHFGKFCAATCIAFPFYYGEPVYAFSIQNEPVFTEPYLSCVYSPEQYRDTCHAVNDAMNRFNVTTQLFGSEDVGTIPSRWMTFVTALQEDPVAWNRMKGLAIHHYPWDHATGDDTNPAAWAALREQVRPTGKPLWQTERSGEQPGWLGGPGTNKGGLYLAREIHEAMKYGDVTLYLYWSITSEQANEYALMVYDQPTTKYYAAKQFFRYIKPGSVRVATSADTPDHLASAYVNDQDHTMTVVLINKAATPAQFNLGLAGPLSVSSFSAVRSSETERTVALAPVNVTAGAAALQMPPHSVLTLVGSTGGATTCYPNCDGSTTAPVLNVTDFTCFLDRFYAQDPWANCDGSTTPPSFNILDFTCYIRSFAAGCP
jgi:O-glycosyl hydrolase